MSDRDEIEIAELLEKLDGGGPLLVLDVRNADEYEGWKIEGRRQFDIAHIPYFDFIEDEEAAAARVPKTGSEIVVVCAKGGSSQMVAEILRDAGLSARSLAGGMIAYGQYLESVKVPLRETEEKFFEISQLNRRGKGCLSYIVISGGEAAVIDPSRAVEIYESQLARAGARLVHVLDTHVHADHLSGGPALAAKLGADYFVGAGAGFGLRHRIRALNDGDELRVGNIAIRLLATPGHTPGSVCYLVGDRYLLTGDTLFKTSVGRPDLGGQVEEWSKSLFQTLRARIGRLDDATVVLPAHYADISEIGLDGVVSAKLGELRRDLPELRMTESASFIEAMRRALGTPPPQYAEIIDTNLGNKDIDSEHAIEWELGKNQCAASGGPAAQSREARVR